jgi:ParB family chromosome partitioning protein
LDPKGIVWPEGRITSEYDAERAEALRRSMAEMGQQDAVGVVELEDGTYEGAAGMNRCLAAIESGTAQVLCVVRRGSHRDVVKANIATSVNQSRANPLSEVEGIANAHYNEGFGFDELLAITGKSEGWIEDRLAISRASPVVKECLRDGRIAIGHATVLAGIEDHTQQEEALQGQLAHGWTVRELEEHLRGPGGGDAPGAPEGRRQPRVHGPLVCSYCATERERVDVQTLNVCSDCAGRLKSHPPAGEGEVAAPVSLLREAEAVLAGSQAGAPLAERIADLVERATASNRE